MASTVTVAAFGLLALDFNDEGAVMIAPIVLPTGEKLLLRVEGSQLQILWEFLQAVRRQHPHVLGVQ